MKRAVLKAVEMLCVLSVFSCIPAEIANAKNVNSVNYGTIEEPVIGPDGFVHLNLSVSDDAKNIKTDKIEFVLSTKDGEQVASWKGTDISTFTAADSKAYTISKDDKIRVFYSSLNDPVGDLGTFRGFDLTDKETNEYIATGAAGSVVEFGKEYGIDYRYLTELQTDLVLPAYTIGSYADPQWADRKIEWRYIYSLVTGKDSDDPITDDKVILFNDEPGTVKKITLDDRGYTTSMRGSYNGGSLGGTGNGSERHLSDKSLEYSKITINLHEQYPLAFNEDGSFDAEIIKNQYHFDMRHDEYDPLKICVMFFKSGDFISAPIPDEHGNVTFYVEKKSQSFSAEIHTVIRTATSSTSAGGPKDFYGGYADKILRSGFRTLDYPEDGISFLCTSPGDYTIKAVNLPEYYEIAGNQNFKITYNYNRTTPAEYVDKMLYIDWIKRSLKIKKSENGKVTSSKDLTEKIPALENIILTAEPEKGYRFAGYKCYISSGNQLSEDVFNIPLSGSFLMPTEDITVEPVFKEIVKGDVDGNDTISISDLVKIKSMILLSEIYEDKAYYEAADMNSDGTVNISDYMKLLRSILSE